MRTFEIPYTPDRHLTFELPLGTVAKVYSPKKITTTESTDRLIQQALDCPLGSPSLENLVKSGDKILIICDDITRPTPASTLIPPILERLNQSSIPDTDIELLFALGTHRPMGESEMRLKVGEEVFQRIRCHNHHAFDHSELVYYGKSEEGIPVWLNARLREASIIIGIGDIVPHPIAGFAGGAKILYPGVAGVETIAGFHVSFGLDPENRYGSLDAPSRTSIHRLAKVGGLDFLVNTVLMQNSEPYAVLAGDYIHVYEGGVQIAREIYGVPTERYFDIVIVSSYPAWMEFWQGGKGVYAGASLAKPGGVIILVTACPERIARTHPDFGTAVGQPPEEVSRKLARGEYADAIGAAIAVKVARLRERYHIFLVSDGLTQEDAGILGVAHFKRVEDALMKAFSIKGHQAEIGIIPHGGHTYCYLTS